MTSGEQPLDGFPSLKVGFPWINDRPADSGDLDQFAEEQATAWQEHRNEARREPAA